MTILDKIKNHLPEIGRFSSRPAEMIDKAYLAASSSILEKVYQFFKIRAIYILLFLPMVIIDLVVSGIIGAGYAFASFFVTDATQQQELDHQKKFATIFSKNLMALLLYGFGLFRPKLIAFFFTPNRKLQHGVLAGGGYHYAPNAELKKPQNIKELQDLIRHAIQNNQKIIPRGAGLSQGKQFIPDNDEKTIVVDLENFNTITIHPDEKIAEVGAGARWSDIQLQADKFKLALQVMQASNVFSVAGSISTNIHGWDHKNGVLSNTIVSMTIINTQGEKQTIMPDSPLFHHITGGLGLFGIIVSVKIKLTDNVLLQEQGQEINIQEYTQYFRNHVEKDDKIKMHLFRLSIDPDNLLKSGVAVNYTVTEDTTPQRTKNLNTESDRGTRKNQILVNLARRFNFIRKRYWQSEKERLVRNESKPLTTNEIMQPPINAMFNPSVSEAEWLQEYFLPEDNLHCFLEDLSNLLSINNVPLINASVRFVKQHDQSPFSYAYNGDRFAVVICFNQALQAAKMIKARKWLRKAQEIAIQLGGTYYLPYQHISSPEMFQKGYPKAQEALVFKTKIDPDNLLTSGFHKKYLANNQTKVNHFKVIMSSERNKKEFAGFLKNVLQRVDTDKLYALLEDILNYNDSHEEIYQELLVRLKEIMPSTIKMFPRILKSLSSIKNDLAEQARAILPPGSPINGIVEIGYPGRFIKGFTEHYQVSGTIAAVCENESLSDYVQTGYPRPYSKYIKLDYAKPNLTGLDNKSADIITCYVGLHHFPKDELDYFLKEVKRVLRPHGHFLLVDHDVIDDTSLSMAHMAHMIFNATSGVPLQEEVNELRNFQPMSYWKERLQKIGLGYAVDGPDVAMIREGDPSRNRMVHFINPAPQLMPIFSEENSQTTEPAVFQSLIKSPQRRSSSPLTQIASPYVNKKVYSPVLFSMSPDRKPCPNPEFPSVELISI